MMENHMMFKPIVTTLVASTLLIGGVVDPACASSTTQAESSSYNATQDSTFNKILTERQKNAIDKYVVFDGRYFKLTQVARFALSDSDYETAVRYISETNSVLADISASTITSRTDESLTVNLLDMGAGAVLQGEGVTKVQFFWWGVRVYLSKTTLNRAGGGIAIAGLWIPEPIVSKVFATLGVVAGLSPHGVVFDATIIPTFQILPWTIRFQ